MLPDGAVRFIFNLGDAPPVGGRPSSRLEIVGASASPVVVQLSGRLEGFSVALRPGAAAALLGLPAGAIEEQSLPMELLLKQEAMETSERLQAAPDDTARVSIVQDLLTRRLMTTGDAPTPTTLEAVQLIRRFGGNRSIRDVAAAVGIGERRLQQLFRTEVGLSPRTFSRLARLHACLRALRHGSSLAWAQVAVERGFYDQSHLVNEFRALCGITPTEFLAHISHSSKTTR